MKATMLPIKRKAALPGAASHPAATVPGCRKPTRSSRLSQAERQALAAAALEIVAGLRRHASSAPRLEAEAMTRAADRLERVLAGAQERAA